MTRVQFHSIMYATFLAASFTAHENGWEGFIVAILAAWHGVTVVIMQIAELRAERRRLKDQLERWE